MSRNPFRQARDNQEKVTASEQAAVAGIFDLTNGYQDPPPKQKSTKVKKKVVIKTPPRSPEETQRRLSLGYPPSPVIEVEVTAYDDADPEDGVRTTNENYKDTNMNATRNDIWIPTPVSVSAGAVSNRKAPFNPFARTLATSEGEHGVLDKQEQIDNTTSRSKPAFDVDMFKNILLNGASPPVVVPATAPEVSETAERLSQTGFERKFPSLDAERQPQTLETASPNDDSDTSDSEGGPLGVPQSNKHGQPAFSTGPQTVSFDDIEPPRSLLGSIPATTILSQTTDSPNTSTDKPLPATPADSKSPVPPPPPMSRRQAQNSASSRRRSSSILSRSSIQSDSSSIAPQSAPSETGNTARAPPPPPSRRSNNRSSFEAEPLSSPAVERPSMIPPPAPAPRRAPTRPAQLDKRSSSNNSRSSLQPLTENTPSGAIRPRVPPRRSGESNRSSIDGSLFARRSSGPDSRRVSNDFEMSSTLQSLPESRADMLSDLAALQKEVDELRAKAAAG